MAQGCTPLHVTQEMVMEDWRRALKLLYPDLEHGTHFVPPVYFNRVPCQEETVAGQPVLVTASPGCDAGDDFAQQHLLHCLQKLGEKHKEPMFVISQLEFTNYLNQSSQAQATQLFPRPAELRKEDRRGDFDLLIVHRRYGILIGEIKSVGFKVNATPRSDDDPVTRRVSKATSQLKKCEKVIKHIFKDIDPGLSIKKTLIFPYVTSSQLQQVLSADSQLQKEVCRSVGDVDEPADALQLCDLCLCADQLSNRAAPHDVTPATLSALESWFRRRMSRGRQMSLDVYVDILARIVGPATSVRVHCVTTPRVEVGTLGEAVSELGKRMAIITLTPQQLNLLNRAQDLPMVCLVGPPGTGKSLVLVLVGLHWLREGHDVLVISTDNEALAVSIMIHTQLKETLSEDPSSQTPAVNNPSSQTPAGTARFLYRDLSKNTTDDDEVIESILKAQTRHIIMDEADFRDRDVGPRLRRILEKLKIRVPDLHLWAATLSDQGIPKELELQVEPLTVPLRSCPTVVREVEEGLAGRQIRRYSTCGTPPHSDGPSVIRIRHEGSQHTGRWPVMCHLCGRKVADELFRLQVGVTGSTTTTTTTTAVAATTTAATNSTTSKTTTTSPPPLRYRDVVVLTRSSELRDDVTDDAGNMTSPACGFVSALRDAGVPVCVIREDDGDAARWEKMAADLAVAGEDHVTVAHYSAVSGLERKVVVVLQGRYQGYDDKSSREHVENEDRILAMSRCSAQLVTVEVPPSDKDSDKQGNCMTTAEQH